MISKDIRDWLIYEPATGRFYWRVAKGCKRKGSPAGSIWDGYWIIRIHSRNYRACRLAFLYMKGRWPKALVDHKNGNTFDDRWRNLREASFSQNVANSRRMTDNRSGYKGVTLQRDKFRARIVVFGVEKHLGIFDRPELAHAAYVKAARKHFGEFARAR